MKALLSSMKKNKTMKILLFTSDKRSFNYLINIYSELVKRGHEVFFLYTESETTKYPSINLDHFNYDCNIDFNPNSGVFSKSLNTFIPFIPDYLILSRERWQPEQSIIQEFKEGFNSKNSIIRDQYRYIKRI
jgi:hypothetical protein